MAKPSPTPAKATTRRPPTKPASISSRAPQPLRSLKTSFILDWRLRPTNCEPPTAPGPQPQPTVLRETGHWPPTTLFGLSAVYRLLFANARPPPKRNESERPLQNQRNRTGPKKEEAGATTFAPAFLCFHLYFWPTLAVCCLLSAVCFSSLLEFLHGLVQNMPLRRTAAAPWGALQIPVLSQASEYLGSCFLLEFW